MPSVGHLAAHPCQVIRNVWWLAKANSVRTLAALQGAGGPSSRRAGTSEVAPLRNSAAAASATAGGGSRGLWGGFGGLEHPHPATAAAAAAATAALPGAGAGGGVVAVFGDVALEQLPGGLAQGLPEFADGALRGLQLVCGCGCRCGCALPVCCERCMRVSKHTHKHA